MSLQAIGLQLSVGTVLTSRQIPYRVSTEVYSDHREWSHRKVRGQGPILAPCIEIWRSIRPPCPRNSG